MGISVYGQKLFTRVRESEKCTYGFNWQFLYADFKLLIFALRTPSEYMKPTSIYIFTSDRRIIAEFHSPWIYYL